MFVKIRKLLGLNNFTEDLFEFQEIEKSLNGLNKDLDLYSNVYSKKYLEYKNTMNSKESKFIKDKVSNKFNNFLHNYKKDILNLKKEINNLQKNKTKILKDEKILKSYNEIKNYNILKLSYKKGLISKSVFDVILKSKNKKIKYSDTIAFNEDGKLLILKRANDDDSNANAWVIPGGHVDAGEEFEEAALRELEEESGFYVKDRELVGEYSNDDVEIKYYKVNVNSENHPIILQDTETQDYKWIDLEDIDDYDFVFNMKDNIKKILNLKDNSKTVIKKALKSGLIDLSEFVLKSRKKEKIIGGLADNKSVKDIANKYNVSEEEIKEQLKIGVKVELEHTNNSKIALEIAKDHLWEISDYYSRLKEMEKEAEAGEKIEKGGKLASLGEVRTWANGERYKKTIKGWENVKTGVSHQEELKKIDISWLERYKSYNLSRLPLNVKESEVEKNFKGNIDEHWVLKWTDPVSGKESLSYTHKFLDNNAKKKWERIESITEKEIKDIKDISIELLKNGNEKEKQIGSIINIICNTGLRIGNREGFLKTKNRGVTTLNSKNIKINGSKVDLEFIGKSYQNNTASVDSKELSDFLKKRVKSEKNNDFVFSVTDGEIRNFFKKSINDRIKIKDLRTYIATKMAKDILFNDKLIPPPLSKNKKEAKRMIQKKLVNVFKKVSSALNNTPSMAKSSYIHPKVINDWILSIGAEKIVL